MKEAGSSSGCLEAIVEPVSLYEPVFSDGNDTIYVMDQIGDKNDDSTWLEEIAVKEAITNLSDREKRIPITVVGSNAPYEG